MGPNLSPPPHTGITQRPRKPLLDQAPLWEVGRESILDYYILKYVQIYIWTHYAITKTLSKNKNGFAAPIEVDEFAWIKKNRLLTE
jgi:hypothetical protein